MSITKFLPTGLKLDKGQLTLIQTLEEIAIQLEDRHFLKFFNASNKVTKGIYLHGGVGSGKTMIMEAFYQRLTINKRMVHYQDFMQSIHKNIHILQKKLTPQIINKLAKDYSNQAKLICIDEFEIKDITDAMIMSKLFFEFIKLKVVIFVTTNIKPDEIYKDGLQRNSVLPLINLIKNTFTVIHLHQDHDYRLDKILTISTRIFYPLNKETKGNIQRITLEFTNNNNLLPTFIQVFGRKITFAKTYKKMLITNCEELFMQALGYIDYVNICQNFTIIIVEDMPIIPSDNTDLATRFINFIDNAYFYKILLFLTLADSPENIYKNGPKSQEFKRTLSRLHEMNSNLYTKAAAYDEF